MGKYVKESSFKAMGLIAFIISIGGGAAQFLTISLLNNNLSVDNFSQVSTVFSSYGIFYLFLELGIQAEIIRRFSKQIGSEIFSTTLFLRLGGAILAFLGSIAFIYISELSLFSSICVLIYSLSYIPIAGLICIEELGYASKKTRLTILNRLGRITATASFTVIAIYLIQNQGQGASIQSPAVFLCYPLAYASMCLWGFYQIRTLDLVSLPSFKKVVKLLKSVSDLILSCLIRTIFFYAYSVLLIRTFGETGLSAYNVSLMLMAPLSIFIQILLNIMSAKINAIKGVSLEKQLLFILLIATVICGGYAAFFSIPTVRSLFFNSLDHLEFISLFIPLTLAQIVMSLIGILNLKLMEKGLGRLITLGTLIQACTVFLVYGAMGSELFSNYYTLPILLGLCSAYIFQHLAGLQGGLFQKSGT